MMFNGGIYNGQCILFCKLVELMIVDYMCDIFYGLDGQGFGFGFKVVIDFGVCGMFGFVGDYGWGGVYYFYYWVDLVEEFVVVYFM